jgi:hypothetical protein
MVLLCSLRCCCALLRCCIVALCCAAASLRCLSATTLRLRCGAASIAAVAWQCCCLLLDLRHPRHGSACMLVASDLVALAPPAPWRGSEREPVERLGSDGDSVVVTRGAATAYGTAGIVSRAQGPKGSAHPGLPSTATGRWPPHVSRRAGPKGHRHHTFPQCGTLLRSRHTAGASGSSLALLLRGCGRISPASGQTTSAAGPGRCPFSGQWANHFDHFSFIFRPVCIHSAAASSFAACCCVVLLPPRCCVSARCCVVPWRPRFCALAARRLRRCCCGRSVGCCCSCSRRSWVSPSGAAACLPSRVCFGVAVCVGSASASGACPRRRGAASAVARGARRPFCSAGASASACASASAALPSCCLSRCCRGRPNLAAALLQSFLAAAAAAASVRCCRCLVMLRCVRAAVVACCCIGRRAATWLAFPHSSLLLRCSRCFCL